MKLSLTWGLTGLIWWIVNMIKTAIVRGNCSLTLLKKDKMISKALMERGRMGERWLNVGQMNGKTAWGLFYSLEITCKPSLPSFLSLSLTHGDLACLAEGEKSGNKRMSDQCRVAMASWVIWSKPSKMEGQAVARLCCEKERALRLSSLKRTRPLFTHTDIPL